MNIPHGLLALLRVPGEARPGWALYDDGDLRFGENHSAAVGLPFAGRTDPGPSRPELGLRGRSIGGS